MSMEPLDLVLRNADIVTAGDRFSADIGVRGGTIVAIADALPRASADIDVDGRMVTPGGVDGHCHLDQPMSDGSVMADDFASGTRSAACGGTTTIIPFACQIRGRSVRAAVDDYHHRAAGKALIDYAFHLIVTDPTPQVLNEELPALIAAGYSSFKLYMTYDDLKLNDRQILELLAVARREGAMAMIHAENADCIAWLTEQLLDAGISTPIGHALSRPMAVEREATHRAIALAEVIDTPVLIVHVSGREAIEQIRWAQGPGVSIYAETCPHYLFLTEESLAGGFGAAGCICSPPPRDEANRQAVWDGLRTARSTSCRPITRRSCAMVLRANRLRVPTSPFNQVPNGIPGIETRLPLLMSGGVATGRIEPQTFVALTATNPARLYGLTAQRHDRDRQRRRSRDLGARTATPDHQQHAASCGGLHALRRTARHRMAGIDVVAR